MSEREALLYSLAERLGLADLLEVPAVWEAVCAYLAKENPGYFLERGEGQ